MLWILNGTNDYLPDQRHGFNSVFSLEFFHVTNLFVKIELLWANGLVDLELSITHPLLTGYQSPRVKFKRMHYNTIKRF